MLLGSHQSINNFPAKLCRTIISGLQAITVVKGDTAPPEPPATAILTILIVGKSFRVLIYGNRNEGVN